MRPRCGSGRTTLGRNACPGKKGRIEEIKKDMKTERKTEITDKERNKHIIKDGQKKKHERN